MSYGTYTHSHTGAGRTATCMNEASFTETSRVHTHTHTQVLEGLNEQGIIHRDVKGTYTHSHTGAGRTE